MRLLEECIEALQIVKVNDEMQSNILFREFEKKIPFTSYGRIDWSCFEEFNKINLSQIYDSLVEEDNCFIYWNDFSLPVLESKLSAVVNKIDDVLAVSFDTWLFIDSKNIVIEFYHDGEITIGKCPPSRSEHQ